MLFAAKKVKLKTNISKGVRFILIDTQGKGYCPFYYKYIGQGKIVPKRSVQSITKMENGILFLTTREENHRLSIRDIVFQMHLIRDYCVENKIECAYLPMQMWSKDRHNMFWLTTLMRKIFKNTSTEIIV